MWEFWVMEELADLPDDHEAASDSPQGWSAKEVEDSMVGF